MDEISKLMVEQLRDAYSAEKQALRAMPRAAKKASSQALKDALQAHVEQTEHQVERLEQALEKVGARPGRKVCEGMRGIIEEGQHELEDHDKGPLLDAVACAMHLHVDVDDDEARAQFETMVLGPVRLTRLAIEQAIIRMVLRRDGMLPMPAQIPSLLSSTSSVPRPM